MVSTMTPEQIKEFIGYLTEEMVEHFHYLHHLDRRLTELEDKVYKEDDE